ncbi:MAG: hypothetical protein IPO70_05305 [Bacteroidetes bacterium]|nr:hypothetical protein [Bacteroidota bacterium]
MKQAEIELIEAILKLTLIIDINYPELNSFLAELSETLPDRANPKINTSILHDYFESLNELLSKYITYTTINQKNKNYSHNDKNKYKLIVRYMDGSFGSPFNRIFRANRNHHNTSTEFNKRSNESPF